MHHRGVLFSHTCCAACAFQLLVRRDTHKAVLIVVLIFHFSAFTYTHSPADRSQVATFDICRDEIKKTHISAYGSAAFYYYKSAKWPLLFNKFQHQETEPRTFMLRLSA